MVRASGAPRHLGQQLERAFARAQVAALQAQVGIDNTHQGQHGEVVPLGRRLRGHHHIDLAALHARDQFPRGFAIGRRVGGEHLDARLRKQAAHFFFDAFDAGPDGDERVDRAAVGTGLGLWASRSR